LPGVRGVDFLALRRQRGDVSLATGTNRFGVLNDSILIDENGCAISDAGRRDETAECLGECAARLKV
jgi:hypothetical protein